MMSPSHFFDNAFGGSAHGIAKGGLTDAGREMVARMEARGMLVDVAHASAATIDDVLAMADPAGRRLAHRRARRRRQRPQPDRRARSAGSPRPAGWSASGSGRRPAAATTSTAIARSIRYAVDVAGVEHVGLGSDFDGAVPDAVRRDRAWCCSPTRCWTRASTRTAIAKVMGGNVRRLLADVAALTLTGPPGRAGTLC